MRKLFKLASFLVLTAILLSACGQGPSPELNTQATVDAAVKATVGASKTATPAPAKPRNTPSTTDVISTPAASATPDLTTAVVRYRNEGLSIYPQPDAKTTPVVKYVPNGTKLTILGRCPGSWLFVEYKGQRGCIALDRVYWFGDIDALSTDAYDKYATSFGSTQPTPGTTNPDAKIVSLTAHVNPQPGPDGQDRDWFCVDPDGAFYKVTIEMDTDLSTTGVEFFVRDNKVSVSNEVGTHHTITVDIKHLGDQRNQIAFGVRLPNNQTFSDVLSAVNTHCP